MINASTTGKPALDLNRLSQEGEFYIFAAALSAHAVGRILISLMHDAGTGTTGTALHTRIGIIVFGLMVVFIASLSYMAFLANKGLATSINPWFVTQNSVSCAIASFLVGLGVMLVEEEE